MSMIELRAFLAVAEHQSFMGAATALGVARTSLRRHVEVLEAMVGVPLFERDNAGVVLTEAGQLLAARGASVAADFAALLALARESGAAPAGIVRMTLPVGLPPQGLAAALSFVRTTWPSLQLDLRFDEAPLTTTNLETDILVWFGLTAPPSGAWDSYMLAPCPLRLVATASYLATHGTPQQIDDLTNHSVLFWTGAGGERRLPQLGHDARAISPTLASPDADLLYQCARRDLGLAWVPDAAMPTDPHAVPLLRVLPDIVTQPMELRLAVRSSMARIPRLRALLASVPQLTRVAMS